jgi:hypothetical protein
MYHNLFLLKDPRLAIIPFSPEHPLAQERISIQNMHTIPQLALEEPEKGFDRSLFRPLQMPSDTVPVPVKPLDA